MKTKYGLIFLLTLLSPLAVNASSSLFSTDAKAVFSHAQKTHLPVLIDFFGIWCPPCNQMDETVFDTPAFVQKAVKFELLKVDVDQQSSWALKDKYKIGGYPTLLFTDYKGDEIYRVVGARSPQEFFRVMDMVLSAKAKNYREACKSKNTDDLWRCAMACSERKDDKCAQQAYQKLEKKLEKGSARYELARTYFVENAENKDLKRDGYERLMTEFPDSPLALIWGTEYLSTFTEGQPTKEKKMLLEKVVGFSPGMMKDARREEVGMAETDVLELRAEILGRIGKFDESKVVWKEAADRLATLTSQLPAGVSPRGFAMERVECLESAGDVNAALKLANEFRSQYPKEFTFHFLAARVLQDAKRFPDALPVAQQAFDNSYGDNRIRAATMLLELYATVPNKEAGRKIYEEVIKDKRPATSLDVRTNRYFKKLDSAWKKLNS